MHAQHDNIDFREGKLLVQDITSLTQQLHIPLLQLATFILENSVVTTELHTHFVCMSNIGILG